MSNEGSKGLRAELGDGYLGLLDSVRHSFEQAAWGQEATGNLADDFYRWIEPANTSKPQEAERGGGEVGLEATLEEYDEFTLWIDEVPAATVEAEVMLEAEQGRDGPGLGE